MVPAPSTIDDFEVVIGLEVHAQLPTRSKMFCRCSTDYSGAEPNTHVCPVCIGMPGVLPVINAQAVEYTIMTGLALNCDDSRAREVRPQELPLPGPDEGLPDLASTTMPLCVNGYVDVEVDGETAAHPRQPRPPGRGHRAPAAPQRRQRRGLLAARRQPRRHAADGDRHGAGRALAAGGAGLPDEAAPDPALHRRQRRQHGGRQLPLRAQPQPAPERLDDVRLQGRAEEPQQLPRRAARHGVRGRAPGAHPRRGRPRRVRDARLARGDAARRPASARKSRRTTTATSPSPTCRRSPCPASRSRSCARRLPELPDARRERFVSAVRPHAPTRPTC